MYSTIAMVINAIIAVLLAAGFTALWRKIKEIIQHGDETSAAWAAFWGTINAAVQDNQLTPEEIEQIVASGRDVWEKLKLLLTHLHGKHNRPKTMAVRDEETKAILSALTATTIVMSQIKGSRR